MRDLPEFMNLSALPKDDKKHTYTLRWDEVTLEAELWSTTNPPVRIARKSFSSTGELYKFLMQAQERSDQNEIARGG